MHHINAWNVLKQIQDAACIDRPWGIVVSAYYDHRSLRFFTKVKKGPECVLNTQVGRTDLMEHIPRNKDQIGVYFDDFRYSRPERMEDISLTPVQPLRGDAVVLTVSKMQVC
jgi:hypothetical protein